MSHRLVVRRGPPGFAAAAGGGGHSAQRARSRGSLDGVGVATTSVAAGGGCSAHHAHSRGPLDGAGVAVSGPVVGEPLPKSRARRAQSRAADGVRSAQRPQSCGSLDGAGVAAPGAGVGEPFSQSRACRAQSRNPGLSEVGGVKRAANLRVSSHGPCRVVPPWKRARHSPCLSDGALRHRNLMVNKTITNFARYPDRRPVGLTPSSDGSLNIDQLWVLLGTTHGTLS